MKRAIAFLATLMVTFAGGSILATSASAEPSYEATCTGSHLGIPNDWTGKDPSDCLHRYILYKDGKPIMNVNNVNEKGWAAIKRGNAAAQDWCSDNSLTCSFVAAAAIAVVSPLISIAS